MKAKFFEFFQVLHTVKRQAYRFKLQKKFRIPDVFYMSLLKWNSTRKGQVDMNDAIKLDAANNKSGKYKVEVI